MGYIGSEGNEKVGSEGKEGCKDGSKDGLFTLEEVVQSANPLVEAPCRLESELAPYSHRPAPPEGPGGIFCF